MSGSPEKAGIHRIVAMTRNSVSLPADYASTTDRLPVIYTLDGGIDNGNRFSRMVTITQEQGVRAVLIGIGGYARRETDYRLPGAGSFYAFVTTELIPYIESRYRIDPATRTLAGHSYGGFFTVMALLEDRPASRYFENFISQDIATFDQETLLFAMEQELFSASSGNLPGTTLILSGDTLGFDVQVELRLSKIFDAQLPGPEFATHPRVHTRSPGNVRALFQGFHTPRVRKLGLI